MKGLFKQHASDYGKQTLYSGISEPPVKPARLRILALTGGCMKIGKTPVDLEEGKEFVIDFPDRNVADQFEQMGMFKVIGEA